MILVIFSESLFLLMRCFLECVPVKDMKSSATSSKRHSSESSKSKERKTSKERKIKEKMKVADVDSIIMENLPAPKDREVGHFQMNDLMTRVLEDELQTIMIEVWRALPDDPPSRTEKYVADKLRNEVSDDLRNVLGLNVTKRLLNVYNPLYVKLHFSHRPESGYLTKFLDSYNAEIFKRINREKSKNTFVARLKSIYDFDKICASRHIKCGTARITVAPFYNFTKCPAKLNSIFTDNVAVENKDSNKNNSNDDITNDDESETIVEESNAEKSTTVDKKISVKDNKTSVPQKITNIEEVKTTVPQKKALKKIDNRDFEMDETEIIDEIGEYDDDDEMNDEEILALIAGGVVVDECSGSDAE